MKIVNCAPTSNWFIVLNNNLIPKYIKLIILTLTQNIFRYSEVLKTGKLEIYLAFAFTFLTFSSLYDPYS